VRVLDIAYSRDALKALRRMPANEARRVRKKVEAYARDPESQTNNVVRLKGRNGYRLRVGDWRVIFDKQGNVMAILAIGPRGGIYED
jgi:mRNA interferase RelE/StbE